MKCFLVRFFLLQFLVKTTTKTLYLVFKGGLGQLGEEQRLLPFNLPAVLIALEHEMEGKLQEHKQELERMKKDIVLERKRVLQETDLKKKVKEVSTACVEGPIEYAMNVWIPVHFISQNKREKKNTPF